jgi:aspartyl-tRNA(Asn)/glutamyl-tRNA(Gln) amidotransferase subunit B
MGEVSRRLNADELSIEQTPVKAEQLAKLISRIHDNTISNNAARQVFDEMWQSATANVVVQITGVSTQALVGDVDVIIEAKGLKQMNDSGELETIVDDVLAANPKNVEEYKAGNSKALNALVGQIMKGSKGKANPQQVNDLLRKKLN